MTRRALLVSTYEMGRQPFGVASAAAWLRRARWAASSVDLAKDPAAFRESVLDADLIAFHLPMHTATRLAGPAISLARSLRPAARLVAFGLYAPLNAQWLRSLGIDDVLGGEFEEELAAIATGVIDGVVVDGSAVCRTPAGGQSIPRIQFLIPDRSALLPLGRYATLQWPDGTRRLAGYTEASRGCKHLCRHCPIVPVYEGQFRVVQPDVVLADIDGQVAAGAAHVTFGDPDFFNGPSHASRIVTALHARHPHLTYDVTIKIEHLLKHRELLATLAATGCLFVTSAVESIDDGVLARFAKGHTRADFVEAVRVCREARVTLVPTFVAFHPWLTLDGYCDLLHVIESLDLVEHVSPVQLAIRLLVPQGSRLLELDEVRSLVGPFDPGTLTYRWRHPDPRVDALHDRVTEIVGIKLTADRRRVFEEVAAIAYERAGRLREWARPPRSRATIPYLNEPWYC